MKLCLGGRIPVIKEYEQDSDISDDEGRIKTPPPPKEVRRKNRVRNTIIKIFAHSIDMIAMCKMLNTQSYCNYVLLQVNTSQNCENVRLHSNACLL